MRELRFLDGVWDIEARKPENFPPVRTEDIPEKRRTRYFQLKRALDSYLEGSLTIAKIVEMTGVPSSKIYELAKDAYEPLPNGRPTGHLACIPYRRTKAYELVRAGPNAKAGRLTKLFADHPSIKDDIDDCILGKKKLVLTARRKSRNTALRDELLRLCRAADIDETEYPFTSDDKGRESLRLYAERLLQPDLVAYARVTHGDDSARLASTSKFGSDARRGIAPYDSVALDGHKLDVLLIVVFEDQMGDECVLVIDRIWLIVALDDASRAVLGYTISLERNYTSEDVLRCVGSIFEPWRPMELPPDSGWYEPGAGLPNAVVEGCAWRTFNTMTLDNAYCQLSEWTQKRIIDAGVLEVITSRPASPRSRNARVERFNRTFAEYTTHELPSTTGSGPNDPRRRNPEAAARRYRISLLDLERIASIAMASYNATPHQSLNGRSPLDYLRMRLGAGRDIVRYAPQRTLSGLGWYDRDVARTVRAYAKHGHWPHINFEGVRYHGPELNARHDLKDKEITFRVDITDIREGLIFHAGECIGKVQAEGPWLERKHSLQIRKAILRLQRLGKLETHDPDPVSGYVRYIGSRASSSTKAATDYVKVSSKIGKPAPKPKPMPVEPFDDLPGLPRPSRLTSTVNNY